MENRDQRNPVVFIVDDNSDVREGLKALLQSVNLRCEAYTSPREFLEAGPPEDVSCLILDVRLPGISGLDFQAALADAGIEIPIIFITGHGDIPMSVRAMKAGAVEFLTKPLHEQVVLDAVHAALERDRMRREQKQRTNDFRARYESLSQREQEVMTLVVTGLLNKQIAAKVGLSEVTVKVHRHNLMKKLGVKSVPDLVRMADDLGLDPVRP
jgi:FixJ family two-component response regulator